MSYIRIDAEFWLLIAIIISLLLLGFDRWQRSNSNMPLFRKEAAPSVLLSPLWLLAVAYNKFCPDPDTPPPLIQWVREWLPLFVIALVIISFLVIPMRVVDNHAAPTIKAGEHITVKRFAYSLNMPVLRWPLLRLNAPRAGDLVVIYDPKSEKNRRVVRIIGMPGDIVDIDEFGQVRINNKPLGTAVKENDDSTVEQIGTMRYAIDAMRKPSQKHHLVLTEDQFYMLNDNRNNMLDSRVWGPLLERDIIGQPAVRLFTRSGITGYQFDDTGEQIEYFLPEHAMQDGMSEDPRGATFEQGVPMKFK